MAKPMPSTPVASMFLAITAVLIPTSSPAALISAPPELPSLIAASVWMKFSKVATPSCLRSMALTMPWVTVCCSPKGLPIASTSSPTCSRSERPRLITGSLVSSTDSSARSVSGSRPTTFATALRPSASCTLMEVALAIT